MTQPIALPLLPQIGARYDSLTVDSRLINGFVEKGREKDEIFVYKRPGFVQVAAGPAGQMRGVYLWRDSLFTVVGGNLYKDNTTLIGAVDANSEYGFTATLGDSPVLFLTNGTHAYTVATDNTLTEVTSNMRSSGTGPITTDWLPACTFINSYIVVFGTDGLLWSSAENDATTWPAIQYIGSYMEPDRPIGLIRHLFSILTPKEFNTEAFYNSGAASILGPVAGVKITSGCVDRRTIADLGGDCAWVARTREGGVSVILVSGMKHQPISTPPIERILQSADFSGDVYSWAAKVDGHRFYGVTIASSNITLVYDISVGIWYNWTTPDGAYLPYAYATIDATNKVRFFHASSGEQFHLLTSEFGDDGIPFTVDIYTPNFDAGTRRYKTLSKLSVFADQVNGAELELSWSDDDYQTWTEPQPVDLSTDDPFWADLGSFKKRAFRLSHTALAPLRLRALEAYVDAGAT